MTGKPPGYGAETTVPSTVEFVLNAGFAADF